jgi:hypothetical protein
VPRRDLDPDALGQDEDWVGLVSAPLHRNGRDCPGCSRSHAEVAGGAKSGGTAWIESD